MTVLGRRLMKAIILDLLKTVTGCKVLRNNVLPTMGQNFAIYMHVGEFSILAGFFKLVTLLP